MANGHKGRWYFGGAVPTQSAKAVCHLYEADGRYTGVTIETLVNGHGQYMDEVRDKNQAMVEAAPEMLAALKMAVDFLDDQLTAAGQERTDKVRALIARAEGRK